MNKVSCYSVLVEFDWVFDVAQVTKADRENQTKIDYEEALENTGIGKFNYIVLFVCSLGLLSNGIQNGISAYLLPSLQCEFNISSSEMALMNVMFMIGGILSAYIWGIFANLVGRKSVIVLAFYADFLTTLVGSFSQGYTFLLFTRLLCGFFTGGPGYLLFTHLADFTPRKVRATYICYAGFCFIISWIILPGVGLLIIPLQVNLGFGLLKFNSWRLYSLLFTLPSFISAVIISKLPESPRQVLSKGDRIGCMKILKKMFVKNTGKSEYCYDVKSITETPLSDSEYNNNQYKCTQCSKHIKNIINETALLFRSKYVLKTTNVIFVMFTSMFGCYGLGLWIPELLLHLRRIQNLYPNESVTVCQWKPVIANQSKEDTQNIFEDIKVSESIDETVFCGNVVDSQIYRDTIMIGMACLCYNFVTACLSQHLNARYLTSISMAFGSLSAFLFVTFSSLSLCLTAISVFQSAMTTANVIIMSVIMAAFPSNLSSMAVCLATLGGRLGAICSNLCFGMLIEISCYYPIFLVVGLSIIGALLIILVKDNEEILPVIKPSSDIDSKFNVESITSHI
ncbi:synaptic vesicle glycoprotein 2B-like [Arctopsyche grandis]|uniref:synaptic vesicle glycoprotein 2B-like n=1 Tax=Arctopsyche grandis TaxID=121162 RepID=UPI00406D7E00